MRTVVLISERNDQHIDAAGSKQLKIAAMRKLKEKIQPA